MNKRYRAGPNKKDAPFERNTSELKDKAKGEIKFQESPIERALKLSSDETIARAIMDLIRRDELN